jgi:hypothetical protein
MKNPFLGKWRIVEMAAWDADAVDLLGPAYITFDQEGGGEFVFCAVTGGLDCVCAPNRIEFTWVGHDELDEASGAGFALLEDDGALSGEIRIHLGDRSTFKARRW